MTVTVKAGGVRTWESASPGSTVVKIGYWRRDKSVVTLKAELYRGATLVGSGSVNVSNQLVGTGAEYTFTLSNNLSLVQVQGTDVVDEYVTVNAGASVGYTCPAGMVCAVNLPSGVQCIDDWANIWTGSIVILPGITVYFKNTGSSSATLRVRKIDYVVYGLLVDFLLQFRELNSAGSSIYAYSTSIKDVPPFTILATGIL